MTRSPLDGQKPSRTRFDNNSNQPLPIGPLITGNFDAGLFNEDSDLETDEFFQGEDDERNDAIQNEQFYRKIESFQTKASELYKQFSETASSQIRWLDARFFSDDLIDDLRSDANSLLELLQEFGDWDPTQDTKLEALNQLINCQHRNDKVLIFSQFADTVDYLDEQLVRRGDRESIASVTGGSIDPTEIVYRFSPESNEEPRLEFQNKSIRILIATDVLSEGQNLQDCFIVVNYDLPWAIIKLIQRAGRVDRIGQRSYNILCYSFLPADGIEQQLRLRARVQNRLEQNAEVVGTDERFFENENARKVIDLYNEEAGILNDEEDNDVDLSSYAYQIWKNATSNNPSLRKIIENLPAVVYSAKSHSQRSNRPEGVLVFLETSHGNNALVWMGKNGTSVTESQFEVLRAAECASNEPPLSRLDNHHQLVSKAVDQIVSEERHHGGQLGRPSGARFKVYERLKLYTEEIKGTLLDTTKLKKVIDDIYQYPLRQDAIDTLNRQLKSGINDELLVELVIGLHDEDRLCIIDKEIERKEPQIICSLGLIDRENSQELEVL